MVVVRCGGGVLAMVLGYGGSLVQVYGGSGVELGSGDDVVEVMVWSSSWYGGDGDGVVMVCVVLYDGSGGGV